VSAVGEGGTLSGRGGFDTGAASSTAAAIGVAAGKCGLLGAVGGRLACPPGGGGTDGTFTEGGGLTEMGACGCTDCAFGATDGGGRTEGGGLLWPLGRGGGGFVERIVSGAAVPAAVIAGGFLLPAAGGAMPTTVEPSFLRAASRSAITAGSWSGLISDCCVVAIPVGSFGGSSGFFGGSCSVSLTTLTIPGRDHPRPKRVTD